MKRICRGIAIASLLPSIAGASGAAQADDLDGFTSQLFKLERLEIRDRAGADPAAIVAPAGWTSWRDGKDNLVLASPDRNYSVEVMTLALGHRGDPAAIGKELVEVFRGQFEARSGRDFRVEDKDGDTLIEGVTSVGAGERRAITHSVVCLRPDARDVYADDAERPEFQELILIIDEQVRRMRIGRPPADREATIETGKRPGGSEPLPTNKP